MVVALTGSTAVLLMALLAFGAWRLRARWLDKLESDASNQVAYYAERVGRTFAGAALTARLASSYLGRHAPLRREALSRYLEGVALANPELDRIAVQWNSGTAITCTLEDAQVVFTESDEVPSVQPHGTWVEVNQDREAAYSLPLTGANGESQGVLTVWLSLEGLAKELEPIKSEPGRYGLLLSRAGHLVASSGSPVANQLVAIEHESPPNHSLIEATDPIHQNRAWLIFHPVTGTPLEVVIVYSVHEEMAELQRTLTDLSVIGVLGLLVLAGVSWMAAGRLAAPIATLSELVSRAARGEADVGAERSVERHSREVDEMASSFEALVRELRASVSHQERLASELKVAAELQRSLLPRDLPSGVSFALAAQSRPAREVGGDLFDFFWIDEQHLGLLVGDVSGKGIPAALYVGVSGTHLRVIGLSGQSPCETLARVNLRLCQDDDSDMFLTAFYGVFNVVTGELRYALAGHPPPLLVSSNRAEELPECPGMPLGIVTTVEFEERTVHLQPGQVLFAFTDGVTEARNDSGDLYGDERLQAALAQVERPAAAQLVGCLLEEVDRFVDGHTAADDVTVLCLEYRGE
ncbi:MAG: SpoIIE family protein phosphatase [Candidatus Eremiobacteraeota bacterium]|nr:SpoIIE family protein phosphatase [Candidatus Eremiobacteraeota bacterium]